MISITVDNELKDKCPSFFGAAIFADIKNTPVSEDLWREIDGEIKILQRLHDTESIKHISGIEATRKAYKS